MDELVNGLGIVGVLVRMFLTRELAVGLLHLAGRCVGLDAEQLMRNEGLQGLNILDDVEALVAEVPEEGEDG